jgi:hypothetical protein
MDLLRKRGEFPMSDEELDEIASPEVVEIRCGQKVVTGRVR